MTRSGLRRLGLLLAASWTVLLLLRGEAGAATALFADSLPPNPWFVPSEALRLYLAVPLAVVAALVVVIAPGVLVVLARGRATRCDELVLHGFGAAFGLHLLAHVAMHVVAPGRLGGSSFLISTAVLCAATYGHLAWRVHRGAAVPSPAADPADRRRLLWCVAIPWAAVVLLFPVLFWQDLTDDGAEALEAGRSLADFVSPRFPRPGALMGLGIGMVSMAYPVHWSIGLFGEIDAAARLPLAFYLPVLFCGVTALAELGAARRLGALEELAVAAALAAFVTTMGFNASYEPYCADVAAPAAFESLTVACMLGVAHSLWTGRTWALVGFTLVAYFARPTGVLFVGLLATARWTFERENRRDTLLRAGAALAACAVAFVVYEKLYLRSIAGAKGLGYSSETILERMRFLRFGDVGRVMYVAIPCGLLPILVLVLPGARDPVTKALSAVSIVYFLFFYVQAFIALHHFTPVMVFPVAVLWRRVLAAPRRAWTAPLAVAAAGIALVLAAPPPSPVYRRTREIASVTAWEIGDYRGDWEAYRHSIDHRNAFFALFRADWDVPDPAAEWSCFPLVVARYASLSGPRDAPAQYVIRPAGDPPPEGCRRVGGTAAAAVHVRDEERWERDRRTAPTTAFRSRWLEIPRSTLFVHVGWGVRAFDLDVVEFLRSVRDVFRPSK